MKQLLLAILATTSIAMSSCSKDEGLEDNPTTLNLAKHWFVRVQARATTSNYSLFSTRTLTVVDIVDTFGSQRERVLTDTIMLDDHNQLSPTFRSNVRINVTARTFGEGQYRNWQSTDNFILKEGKMIRNGG